MKRRELIAKLKTKFYKVNEKDIHQGKTEEGITIWGVGVFEKKGDVIKKQNLTFYTKGFGASETDEAFWGNAEPNPASIIPPPLPETFTEYVNDFIGVKIAAGIIRFGYIEQINEKIKRALCTIVIDDEVIKSKFLGLSTTIESIVEIKKAIVTETNTGFTFFVF